MFNLPWQHQLVLAEILISGFLSIVIVARGGTKRTLIRGLIAMVVNLLGVYLILVGGLPGLSWQHLVLMGFYGWSAMFALYAGITEREIVFAKNEQATAVFMGFAITAGFIWLLVAG
jgi:hypothetical protein